MNLLVLLLALCWIAPACLRTWRMARFYQIEEYKVDRFWAWLTAHRDRWFPRQPAIIMLVGVVVSFVLQALNVDPPALHLVLWLAIAGVVSRPEPVKETKKTFVRTQRAMRLVGTAFTLDALFILLLAVLTTTSNSAASLATVGVLGFIAFLLSPLALPAANALNFPAEDAMRKRFRERARGALQAANLTTIGVTGSYGKTSTKMILAHILGDRALPTPKSYNTLMGISMVINDTDLTHTDYFIAEMGAYVPGEIAEICRLTSPTISIVTAVGPMHLERFGTIENVVKAKYEIVGGLPPDGAAVFNGDDENVLGMAERGYPETRIIVSREGLEAARIVAENIEHSLDGITFDLRDRESNEVQAVQTKLVGLHNVTNILLAAGVARHVGLSLADIAARAATLEPAEHRLNVNRLPNNITIIDDAYSANPVGAVNALEVLKLHEGGRRILITPGMVELGALQEEENFKLGKIAAESATDIVLVGIAQTDPLQRAIAETDFDADRVLVFDTFDEAREWFQTEVKAGDTVLFLNDLPDTYL